MRQVLGRDSLAGVGDRDGDGPFRRRRGHRDASLRRRMPLRILEQVDEKPDQVEVVAPNPERWPGVQPPVNPRPLCSRRAPGFTAAGARLGERGVQHRRAAAAAASGA